MSHGNLCHSGLPGTLNSATCSPGMTWCHRTLARAWRGHGAGYRYFLAWVARACAGMARAWRGRGAGLHYWGFVAFVVGGPPTDLPRCARAAKSKDSGRPLSGDGDFYGPLPILMTHRSLGVLRSVTIAVGDAEETAGRR
eukprot:gene15281-biopygen11216